MTHHDSPRAVHSFFRLADEAVTDAPCRGLACFAARHRQPLLWEEACRREPRHYCFGQCYAAPSRPQSLPAPHREVRSRETVLLGNLLAGGVTDLAEYRRLGGGIALERALAMAPETIISQLELSQLRGRGGAGFPTGRKWRSVWQQVSSSKYVVANADEGDAGAYIDRFLMEMDPFRLIESMLIAGITVGASRGFIYLRREYPHARQVLQEALAQARLAGWLGDSVLDADIAFDIEIVQGKGSYVCGEETAMLNAMEGRRPEVRVKPPYPFEAGLHGQPTLIDNVETLCTVPWILVQGAQRYAALGFSKSRGTLVLSLNSLFVHPGLYEVEFGITLREIVEDIGGGIAGSPLKALMVGGPLAGVVLPDQLETRLGYEEMQAVGASVGHGGVIAFDQSMRVPDLLGELLTFGAYESCGKCVPCHMGTPRMAELWRRLAAGARASAEEREAFMRYLHALEQTSFCGHGLGVGAAVASLVRQFPDEVASCFTSM